MNKKYLTPTDVAEMLMVSPVTIRQWAQKGRLEASHTPGGHRRFNLESVKRFAANNGIRLADNHESFLKILIVDDEQQVLAYLKDALEYHIDGVSIVTANDGFQAGKKLYTFRPDIVLLDLMMPGLDGFEVCQAIKTDPEIQSTRVIAMTGYYDDENINKILHQGAEHCFAKPLDIKALLSALDLNHYSLSKIQG